LFEIVPDIGLTEKYTVRSFNKQTQIRQRYYNSTDTVSVASLHNHQAKMNSVHHTVICNASNFSMYSEQTH